MKKKFNLSICYGLILICICGVCSGCKNNSEVVEGKYVSVGKNKDSYITVTDYTNEDVAYLGECNLQFTNVDLSIFEDFAVNNAVSNYIGVNDLGEGMTEEEFEEEFKKLKEKFASNIDLKKQFSDNKSLFEYGYNENEKVYWISGEIDGSGFDDKYECFVNMEYIPSEKSKVIDEKKYVLEESNE